MPRLSAVPVDGTCFEPRRLGRRDAGGGAGGITGRVFPRSRHVPVGAESVDDLALRVRMRERVRRAAHLDNGLIPSGIGLIGFSVVMRVIRNHDQRRGDVFPLRVYLSVARSTAAWAVASTACASCPSAAGGKFNSMQITKGIERCFLGACRNWRVIPGARSLARSPGWPSTPWRCLLFASTAICSPVVP